MEIQAQNIFTAKQQILRICGGSIRNASSTITKRQVAELPASLLLVEMRGIEPLSKNPLIQLSSGVDYQLVFPTQASVVRLLCGATVLCLTRSTVKGACKFTAKMTLSPDSRSYQEERAVRRPRHCR